jgi:hypothetical protein
MPPHTTKARHKTNKTYRTRCALIPPPTPPHHTLPPLKPRSTSNSEQRVTYTTRGSAKLQADTELKLVRAQEH